MKKLFALVLSLCMLVSMVSVSAMADGVFTPRHLHSVRPGLCRSHLRERHGG